MKVKADKGMTAVLSGERARLVFVLESETWEANAYWTKSGRLMFGDALRVQPLGRTGRQIAVRARDLPNTITGNPLFVMLVTEALEEADDVREP